MRRLHLTACIVLLTAFAAPAPAWGAWAWPVSGDVITPYRNGTDPYATGQHRGIDIAAPVGTPVVAAAGGEVRFAGTAGSSGLTIGIRTGDGYDTSYLHLSSLAVKAGAHVSTGDRIGAVGTSGIRSATAPHLHFGVRDAGTRHDYHDPLTFLPPPPATPAPNPPSSAPGPATEPAPPAAAPVALPGTAPRRAPAPLDHPRTAPSPRSGPVPGRRPHATPRPVPHPLPAPGGAPALRPLPGPAPGGLTARAGHGSPARLPSLDVGRHPAHGAPARHSSLDVGRHPAPTEPRKALEHDGGASPAPAAGRDEAGGSPDFGWAAACAGLLLAAALLGLTDDGRRATRRTRSRVLGALPLLSRR